MTRLREIRDSRGWTKRDLLRELRRVATARGYRLVGDASLSRQIARWENSGEPLGELYTELFTLVYECDEIDLGIVGCLPNVSASCDVGSALSDRLSAA